MPAQCASCSKGLQHVTHAPPTPWDCGPAIVAGVIFVERSGRPIAQRTATSVASAPTINNRRPVNLCLSNCFPMSNWYRRRAAYRALIEADAKALIDPISCSNRHHRLTAITISPITFVLCSRWRGAHVPAFPHVGGGAVAQRWQSDADVRPRRRERFRAPTLANNRRQAGVSGLRLHDLLRLSPRSQSALAMQGLRLRFFGDFGHAVRVA